MSQSLTRPQALSAHLPPATPIADMELLAFLRQTHQIAGLAQAAEQSVRIVQVCEHLGITVSEAELQAAGDAFRVQHRLTTVPQTLAWLQRQRISLEDWSEGIRCQLLTHKLQEQLFGESVDNYYLQNRKHYDRVALSQIVVSDLDLAQHLQKSLTVTPEAFCALALQYSILKEAQTKGGFMGVCYRSELAPELREAISDLEPGAIVGPIATLGSYHLLKLEQCLPTQLTTALRKHILNSMLQVWLTKLS